MDCNCAETEEHLQGIYTKKWPNHCQHCGGWGGTHSAYDPSPAGVSLSSGCMYDFDPCTECCEQGICPRCGEKVWDDDEIDNCPKCGWNSKEDGLPIIECECGLFEAWEKDWKEVADG